MEFFFDTYGVIFDKNLKNCRRRFAHFHTSILKRLNMGKQVYAHKNEYKI